ncbi:MAG: S24/S26 family peptidase [Thermodesulfobacteriota bacterium]
MRKSVTEIINTIKTMKNLNNDYDVADTIGVSRGALSNAKKRNSISFLDELVNFCDQENLSLDFIRLKHPSSVRQIRTIVSPGNYHPEENSELIVASVYSLENADQLDFSDIDPVGSVVLPRDLISDHGIVIRVSGDSMEKLLMKGANAVIDTNEKDIVSGSIYAFNIPHEGNIVRECYSEPRGLSLKPYNKNYPTAQVEWEDFDPDMIIGKVSCSVINVFR